VKPFGWSCLPFSLLFILSCRVQTIYPDKSGILFIRQQICDLNDFKKGFFRHENGLKARGFLDYSFYRDAKDPKTYLLAFKCGNLDQAVRFVQGSNFYLSCVGAGLGLPLIWAGEVKREWKEPDLPQRGGALVVARAEVLDKGAWEGAWAAQPGYTLLRLPGRPRELILSCEMPDMVHARAFVDAQSSKSAMDAAGITRLDFWMGVDLEKGAF
jgi:hypothetical protein